MKTWFIIFWSLSNLNRGNAWLFFDFFNDDNNDR